MSTKRTVDYWIEVGDKYLADGEWHDGLPLIQKLWAAITPSVAMRRAESDRAKSSGTESRTREESDNRLVSIGRRSIVRGHIHSRVRFGILEVQPWPVPANGWMAGGWRVRDLRVGRISLPELEDRFQVSAERIRDLIKQEPALDYFMRGRCTYLPKTELPALEKRIDQYKLKSRSLKGSGVSKRAAERAIRDLREISITRLAELSGIAPTTAGRLRLANPQLPWIEHGEKWHALPVSALPAWNLIVDIHKRGTTPRRVQAMNDARRKKKQARSR